MKLICPECKNDVNLSRFGSLKPEQVIECDVCGITLMVEDVVENGQVTVQIVDEGK